MSRSLLESSIHSAASALPTISPLPSVPPPPVSTATVTSKIPPSSEGAATWDGWPDGDFEEDVDWTMWKETGKLRSHWAAKVSGGYRKGSEFADTWEGGKRSTRQCLGIITCDNDDCEMVIRPQTTPEGISSQLLRRCRCQGILQHKPCPIRSSLWTWNDGVHYSNGGDHNHPRLTHVLHLLPREQVQFDRIVASHPTVGPLGLVVGVPGLKGPGESVADVSDVLLNAERVRKERQKIKVGNGRGGDSFVAEFAKFTEDRPGFVIYSQLGTVTVVSLQTPFMAARLVKNTRLEGPVNGIVSDAAHGWWLQTTSLLIVSSCYSPELLCWVPGLFSYTNGASAEHYKYHFLALFQSMAHEADGRQILITDEMFSGVRSFCFDLVLSHFDALLKVVDFSEAERTGFIMAYIEFWLLRTENNRSEGELRTAAEKLLKGCLQHFRAGVTRIKRISGVIPPASTEAFESRAMALLDASDSKDFHARAVALVRDFPKVDSWLAWWMRESHATMLFTSERRMDSDIWDSIPATTNAEEAMHWKLYCAAGRKHPMMEGMEALYKVAEYYQRLFTGTLSKFILYPSDSSRSIPLFIY